MEIYSLFFSKLNSEVGNPNVHLWPLSQIISHEICDKFKWIECYRTHWTMNKLYIKHESISKIKMKLS